MITELVRTLDEGLKIMSLGKVGLRPLRHSLSVDLN